MNKKELQGTIELHLGGCKQNNQTPEVQNEKIEQGTDTTMVVGIDIGGQIHYARAFDNIERELTKRVLLFGMTLKDLILSIIGQRILKGNIKDRSTDWQ